MGLWVVLAGVPGSYRGFKTFNIKWNQIKEDQYDMDGLICVIVHPRLRRKNRYYAHTKLLLQANILLHHSKPHIKLKTLILCNVSVVAWSGLLRGLTLISYIFNNK